MYLQGRSLQPESIYHPFKRRPILSFKSSHSLRRYSYTRETNFLPMSYLSLKWEAKTLSLTMLSLWRVSIHDEIFFSFTQKLAIDISLFLTLLVPNFRQHLSSALFFNKLLTEKKFICKVERLNVKQCRS